MQNSFISKNIRIRFKSLKNNIFLRKAFMHYSQKIKKNKFPHYIVGIVMVAVSLSDADIKILEI